MRALRAARPEEIEQWLSDVDRSVGGIRWVPLGGIENNVHTVQVSADPSLALVERPINSIDAVLDLRALERGESAPSPHAAARSWWGIPAGGLSEMSEDSRRKLADLIRVVNLESGDIERPTIVIQDAGTGQHPDDFPKTLLSILESNKKSKNHQMGVYNAGGAASYAFCPYTVIISRRAPQLLAGRTDEVGIAVVRYNPLDPDRFKSGTYEYCVGPDGAVLRADLAELPDIHTGLATPGYGTYVKHMSYELSKHYRGAHEPKKSLWHLFHAAIPDPPLPFRIVETRTERFPGMKGEVERRVVMGLLHLLRRAGTADYQDERRIVLGLENGSAVVRYFVVNDDRDPDAYTSSDQGVTITLNGQRQGTKDRYWLKRNTDLHYIFRRLVVIVDGNELTSTAKREVFASTRESHKDSPLTRRILDGMIQELRDDDDLRGLDDAARERSISEATRTTSDRIKKQLANQVAAFLQGQGAGKKGGAAQRPKTSRPKKPSRPLKVDDTAMLEVPDTLHILTDPVTIEPGRRAILRLAINAKNGFLPRHSSALAIVIGPELKDHVRVLSTGRLLGGRLRITLEASANTPVIQTAIQVALVDPALPVFLTAIGTLLVRQPAQGTDRDDNSGGEPDVEVVWIDRAAWDKQDPPWDEDTAGRCVISRHPENPDAISRVLWQLNRGFGPFEQALATRKLSEAAGKAFDEAYAYPLCWGMFQQSLAADEKERQGDEHGEPVNIPHDYIKGEIARLARAVLLSKEPELAVVQSAMV